MNISNVVYVSAFSLLVTPVFGQPITENGTAFSPSSRTAFAITGPVIISTTRIVFETGASLALDQIGGPGSEDPGSVQDGRQIFAVEGDAGEIRNGNRICGSEPITFLTAQRSEFESLTVTFYDGDEPPFRADSTEMCASYSFDFGDPSPPPGPAQLRDSVAAVNPPPSDEPGKWRVSRTENPIDDTPTVVLTLTADQGRSSFGEEVVFIARCKSNMTEAYVVWNDYVGDDSRDVYDEWKWVEVRHGDAPSERQRWSVSTDKQATFAPGWAGNLLKQMVVENRLVLRMTPYGENPVTAIFDTTGMDVHLRELAETCHWSF